VSGISLPRRRVGCQVRLLEKLLNDEIGSRARTSRTEARIFSEEVQAVLHPYEVKQLISTELVERSGTAPYCSATTRVDRHTSAEIGRPRTRLVRPQCLRFRAIQLNSSMASHARVRWFEPSRAHHEVQGFLALVGRLRGPERRPGGPRGPRNVAVTSARVPRSQRPVSRSGPAGEPAVSYDRQVSPRRWLWIHLDAPFDSPQDHVKLTMINSV
jgi:hypothetical protein